MTYGPKRTRVEALKIIDENIEMFSLCIAKAHSGMISAHSVVSDNFDVPSKQEFTSYMMHKFCSDLESGINPDDIFKTYGVRKEVNK